MVWFSKENQQDINNSSSFFFFFLRKRSPFWSYMLHCNIHSFTHQTVPSTFSGSGTILRPHVKDSLWSEDASRGQCINRWFVQITAEKQGAESRQVVPPIKPGRAPPSGWRLSMRFTVPGGLWPLPTSEAYCCLHTCHHECPCLPANSCLLLG